MAIHFDEHSKIFYLESKNTTYAFGIHRLGFLQQLYYGKRVAREDLRYIASQGPRAMRLYLPESTKEKSSVSYNHMLSEMPAYGRGDFREPMYAVRTETGDRLSEMLYVSHEILDQKPMPAGMPAMRDGQTLVVTLRDKVLPLCAKLFYTVYEDSSAIARRVEFYNTGSAPLFLDRAYSFSVDLQRCDFEALSLHGVWARECETERTPLHHGVFEVNSKYGISSSAYNPFLAVMTPGATEDVGEVYGINLIYTGSFVLKAEISTTGTTRLTGGINDVDFCWKLDAGESLATPEVLLVYSDKGIGEMSRNFHDAYRNHLIQPRFVQKHRPIVINNWEGTRFDFDNERLMKIVDGAKGTGIDTFVLDDGWFGARNNDKAGLGDWTVNTEKLQGGLKTIIDYTHASGLKFGLWFEPEMVNPDSELYRAHPDYAIQAPGHDILLGRNQYVLDLTRKDVRDYIVDAVSEILRNHDIDYVKWDFNRSVAENYSASLPADRQQEFTHRFALGFYDLCERLVNGFPHIFFEGCSSGGARFDAGMLYYFPQIWTSDDTDAYMRTRIQYGTSIPYPLSALSCHVSECPNQQTNRNAPFETRARIAHLGATGYELVPANTPAEDWEKVPAQVEAYHEIEDLILSGDLYRFHSTMDSNYFAEAVVSKDKSRAVITAFRTLVLANDEIHHLFPRGLDENTRYYIKELDRTLSGSTIMYAGLKMDFRKEDFTTLVWHLEKADA